MISQKELKKCFNYDTKSGNLIWKISPNWSIDQETIAGTIRNGYRYIGINKKRYLAHRLIWLYHHGYLPEGDMDHINRNPSDNRMENLRVVSRTCNLRNTGNHKNNKSGVKGIYRNKTHKRWKVQIRINGKGKYLGRYTDFDEAVCHRLAAEQCVDWAGCDSSSPAYKYVMEAIQKNFAGRVNLEFPDE